MALYDAYGREVTTTSPPSSDDTVISRTHDLHSYRATIGLTPARLSNILLQADRGNVQQQGALAREMEDRDLELAAVLQTRRLAVRRLPWEVTPVDQDAKSIEIAAFVTENLKLHLRHIVTDLFESVLAGYAMIWLHWDTSTGQARLLKTEPVPTTRLSFYPPDWRPNAPALTYPRLLIWGSLSHGIEIPQFAAAYHKHHARSGFAQRIGLTRAVSWLYLLKNYGLKDWAIAIEKFAAPMIVGKFPRGSQDVDDLIDGLNDLMASSVAAIPDHMMIGFLEKLQGSGGGTGGSTARGGPYERYLAYFDHGYQHAVLGQEASTAGTPGRLGNDGSQNKVHQDLIEADAIALSDTIQRDIVLPLVGFNWGFEVELPIFAFDPELPEDLDKRSQRDERLYKMHTPIPLSYIQHTYGIPAPEAGEEVLQMSSQTPPPMDDPEEEPQQEDE